MVLQSPGLHPQLGKRKFTEIITCSEVQTNLCLNHSISNHFANTNRASYNISETKVLLSHFTEVEMESFDS